METGLTSFLDRVIARSGFKPATANGAQGAGEKTGDRDGQETGSVIAAEFARMLRALRTEAGQAKQSAGDDVDDEMSTDADATADPNVAEETDTEPDGEAGSPMIANAFAWRWNRHDAHDQGEAVGKIDKDHAKADDSSADTLLQEAVAEEDNLQETSSTKRHEPVFATQVAEAATGAVRQSHVNDEKVDGATVAGQVRLAAAADRNTRAAAKSAASHDDTQAPEGEAQVTASKSVETSAARQAAFGKGGDEGQSGSQPGQRSVAHEAAPRGAVTQARVDVVAGQTHLPPAAPASSTVQLLGEAIGEALNELANTGLSRDVSQSDEATQQGASRRMVVDLHPRELGTVRVTLTNKAGELHIEIVPTTDKATDLLNSHRDALTHSIRLAGSAVTEISIRPSPDGGMGRDFQGGQNPAFNWNGSSGNNNGGGERSGDARQSFPQAPQDGGSRRGGDGRPESEIASRSGIYL